MNESILREKEQIAIISKSYDLENNRINYKRILGVPSQKQISEIYIIENDELKTITLNITTNISGRICLYNAKEKKLKRFSVDNLPILQQYKKIQQFRDLLQKRVQQLKQQQANIKNKSNFPDYISNKEYTNLNTEIQEIEYILLPEMNKKLKMLEIMYRSVISIAKIPTGKNKRRNHK